MDKVRKYLVNWTPNVVWTLVVALFYAICMQWAIGESVAASSWTVEFYYLQGLCISVPIMILSVAAKKVKHLWQFLLLGIALVYGGYLVTNSYFFGVIIMILWFVRIVNRYSEAKSLMDSTNTFLLLVFVVYFICTGFQGEVFLQKMTIYHFMMVALLTCNYFGIHRFEEYVRLRKDKANMPMSRIMNTGTRNFVVVSILVILFVVPIVELAYEFVPFAWVETDMEYEYDFGTQEEAGEEESGYSIADLAGEVEPNPFLTYLWAVLEKVMVFVFYIGSVCAVIYGAYKLVVNFNKIQVEKNDIIESTFAVNDEESRSRRKKKVEEFFDFSYTMKVRRKYKRELKKYAPKKWQTPSEMEQMAALHMPELHKLYEEVRYGEDRGR